MIFHINFEYALLVSGEVAEEKDEGIAIKNIGLLMFGKDQTS